jgi:hypothetical protein
MHDLSALETNEQESMEWEGEGDGEYSSEAQSEGEFEGEFEDELNEFEDEGEEGELEEEEELESAAQLLSVGSEAELDHFLGGLIRKVARKVGRSVKAATGNSLGGVLKGLARKALPMVATAIGGPVGGLVAKGGMQALGLELEGLSQEDQELELSRRYVRIANAAASRALRSPLSRSPRANAQAAVRWAVRRHAPGLLRGYYRGGRRPYRHVGYGGITYQQCPPCPVCPECGAPTPAEPSATAEPAAPAVAAPDPAAKEFEFEDEYEYETAAPNSTQNGRWVRRGTKIVLYGA